MKTSYQNTLKLLNIKKQFKQLSLITSTALILGCNLEQEIQTKFNHDRIFYDEREKVEELIRYCKEIQSTGNIADEFKIIDNETQFIINSLSSAESRVFNNIFNSSFKIKNSVQKIMKLANHDWTKDRYYYQYQWILSGKDFGITRKYTKYDSFFKDLKLEFVSFFGEEHDYLKENYSIDLIELNGPKVLVSYKRKGSALEICQLNNTLFAVLKGRFQIGSFPEKTRFVNPCIQV